MRRFALLLSAVCLLGIGTYAQTASQGTSSPAFTLGEISAAAGTNLLTVNPFSPELASSTVSSSLSTLSVAAAFDEGGSASAEPAQGVYGVRPIYPFEGYVGYTFMRFYEVPGTTLNLNGLNFSIIYFPKSWIGADGEFVLGLGSQSPYQARLVAGLGGIRVRTAVLGPNIELWGHALAGATHFTPQTAYGKQGAFAYEVGVGTDISLSRVRYAIRIGADMLGTQYFGTYQLNPKVSAGFVYRF
jgi:hypothetical protein